MTTRTHESSLRRLLGSLARGFDTLNRIQFGAPWRSERRGRC